MIKKALITLSAILMMSGCTIKFQVLEPDPYYSTIEMHQIYRQMPDRRIRIYRTRRRPICTHARMNINGICPYRHCRIYYRGR